MKLAMSFEILFKRRFAKFLRENFDSPEHIAICFGVTARCAQNWLDELNTPKGHVVAKVFTDPALRDSAYQFLGKD